MRLLVPALLVLVLFLPTASAKIPIPGVPVRAGADVTPPTEACPTCFGASVHAAQLPPDGCYDCLAHGARVTASNDASGPHASVIVCRSGLTYECPVDVGL